MYTTVHALVVRDVDYKEHDKILTLVTAEEGRLTVSARGARRQGSRHAAAAQSLCYSRMILSEYQERFTLKEAEVLDSFWPLRRDIERLALGTYFAEIAGAFMPEALPAPDIFRVTLLALRHLSEQTRPLSLCKAAYEMAVLCQAGHAPFLDSCDRCGNPPCHPVLDIWGGVAYCRDCADGELLPLPPGVWQALCYLRDAAPEKTFGFTLQEKELFQLSEVCERYLLAQTDRKFSSLDFYKSLC